MNKKVLTCAIVAALGGFLFGFDTVVISGAEKTIQDIWSLSGSMHGWALSAALWGTVLGAFVGGFPTARYGRKKTLISIGILYFVSAVGSGLAGDVWTFIAARFIGGLGVGVSTIAAPLFIAEIAPAKDRGKLAGMFQFNIVFGILIAFISNYLISRCMSSGTAWRWMLGIEALPALIYTLLCFTLFESPRWLITRAGRRSEGAAIFRTINPQMSASEIEALVNEVADSSCTAGRTTGFWSSRLRTPILLALFIAIFNQLSGINVILYFAPRLLSLAGISNALAASMSLGLTNLIFTMVGLWLIDRLGRRTLLYIGSFGYILSLGICAFAFLTMTEFKVVSSAIDVISGANQVMLVEQKKGYRTAGDEAMILQEFTASKEALMEASRLEGYRGNPVVIAPEASTAEAQAIAEAAKIDSSRLLGSASLLVLLCIIGFIAAHAVGQGAVIWVFISEIFPNDHRASGQALGSFTHWILAATLTFVFPIAIKAFDAGYMFAFFCAMMVLQLLWVRFYVPETKGVTLEQMQHHLS